MRIDLPTGETPTVQAGYAQPLRHMLTGEVFHTIAAVPSSDESHLIAHSTSPRAIGVPGKQ
ncbi:MAG: hypothetical protein R3C09_25825 [Pirellulaceae bacterium]